MSCKIVQGYVITPIELGKGCFGTVYRGYVKDNKSELLAVKTIPLESIKNEEVVRREIEILLKLKSPNIVKFYKPAKTAKHLYFFLEYCQQDLKSYVKSKGGRLSETEVQNILMQICMGLKVVHQNNVIHRDIKPANFLIHNGVVKLSDFGFARVVDDLEEPLFLTFLGSPLYMAPQILAREKFSSKCDVWSLGVTIYEILYGKTPYTASNPKELLENIRTKPLLFPQNIPRSEQIKDLLRQMLKIEEQKRLSMVELINHDYVRLNVKEVEVVSEDSLVQSFASNQSYMSKNKVVTKTSINPDISNNLQGHKEKAVDKGKENDFNIQLKEQNQQINVYLKIQEIDEAMRYKRNVSVFLNVQCNNFFTNASQILPELQFHVGLFILLYHQIRIHSEIKEELQSKKSPNKRFLPEIWQAFLSSIPYQRIMKLIDSDLKHLQSYYKQVKNRVQIGMKNPQNKAKYPDFIKTFEDYHSSAKDNKFNEKAYEAIMKAILTELQKSEKKIKDKRLFSKLLITIRPFKYLKQSLDFGLFYERQEEELQKLRKEFNEKELYQVI